MLLTPAQATAYSDVLDAIAADGITQLESLLAAVSDADEAVVREAVHATLPGIGYGVVAAGHVAAADFFMESAALQGVRATATASPALPAERVWHSLAGYALHAPVLPGAALSSSAILSTLAGGLTRQMSIGASRMITESAAGYGMRVQRVPSAGACAFCAMLGSRGAVYSYRGEITGAGMPAVEADDHKYHDFCRCSIMPLTSENRVQLDALAGGYYETYREAYEKARSGLVLTSREHTSSDGSTKTRLEWVTPSGETKKHSDTTKDILRFMRQELGVH